MAEFTVTPAEGVWTVRSEDGVLVESRAALELREVGRDPVIYFPRPDVAMAMLEKTATVTTCPDKGDATHFAYAGASARIEDVAWSYEAPTVEAAQAIAGYIAFYAEKLTVERV